MTYITMGGLDHVLVSAFSWTPQHRIALSWDLLTWISAKGRIPCSFTNFITTPKLSGPLYISPDIYHTQITEYYSLQTIYRWALLSASNIFLILILLLGSPHFITWSDRTGALGNTFPVLFQLKWFFIYYDQLVQNAFYAVTPRNWCLIRWRLLLSGFRSVLVDATDKPLRLKSDLCLGTWFRANCMIASRANSFDSLDQFLLPPAPRPRNLNFWLWSLRFERIICYQLLQPMWSTIFIYRLDSPTPCKAIITYHCDLNLGVARNLCIYSHSAGCPRRNVWSRKRYSDVSKMALRWSVPRIRSLSESHVKNNHGLRKVILSIPSVSQLNSVHLPASSPWFT